MRSNRKLYKEAFSKLHASEQPLVLREDRYRHRNMRKSAVACLAAAGILLVATTVTFAMTGEGPVEFFKSFFKNGDSLVSEEINGSYVVVGNQSIDYKNRRIVFEGYSYTGDTLLAKFRVSPVKTYPDVDGAGNAGDSAENLAGKEIKIFARNLSFMPEVAGSASTNLESGEDGSVIISVRMNLDWEGDTKGAEGESLDILVWDREIRSGEQVGIFTVGTPSAISKKALKNPGIPNCKNIVITSLNVKLHFDTSVREEETNPVRNMELLMKDGTVYHLYDRERGSHDEVVSGISFGWSENEDSALTIRFSNVLDLEEMSALIVNGKEYDVGTGFAAGS